MPPHYLHGTLPTKNVFTKQKLKPPHRHPNGSGGKHRKGGMGASAPIMTSNDSPEQKLTDPGNRVAHRGFDEPFAADCGFHDDMGAFDHPANDCSIFAIGM